jgi:hypothetical protein
MRTSLWYPVINRPANLNTTQECANSAFWTIIKYRTIHDIHICLHSKLLRHCNMSTSKQSNGLTSQKAWIVIDKAVRTTDMADLYRYPLVMFNTRLIFLSFVDIAITTQNMLDHCPWKAVIRCYKTSQVNTEKLPQYRGKFEHGRAEHRILI